MKYELFMASRPDEKESILEKDENFIRDFFKVPGPFHVPDIELPALKITGDLSEDRSLSRFLPKGITGYVSYRNRSRPSDYGIGDDVLELAFTPSRIEYSKLINGLSFFISKFNAYYLRVYSKALLEYEANHCEYVNRREAVGLFHPIHFLSEQIWQNSFGISAAEVAMRLKQSKSFERVEEVNGGVLVVCSSLEQTLDEQKQADFLIRRALE